MPDYTQLNRTLIRIKGIDAEKFLQGQISTDVASLSHNKVSYSTLNDPKGRMYGLFKILRLEDDYLLSLHTSTVDQVISKLSKYVVFFKCKITKVSTAVVSGLTFKKNNDQAENLALPSEPMHYIESNEKMVIQLPSHGAPFLYEIWHLNPDADDVTVSETGSESWNALETLSGIPEVYESTQGAFILQDLNLQELGAVSFKKGCYTGQEIIARMKYLGKQKKKTYLIQSEQNLTILPKQYIYDSSGKRCGTVVRSHRSDTSETVALAVINKLYTEENTVVYSDEMATHALTIREIHYTS